MSIMSKIRHLFQRILSYNPFVTRHRNHKPSEIEEIRHELRRLACRVEQIFRILTSHPRGRASTIIFSDTGAINMPQTSLKSIPGTDTLTFQTFDSSTPPVDITSRCTYTVASDGPAVAVGSTSGSSSSVTYSLGTANLTISTRDSGGDTIPDVVLACSITAPVVGATTTVTAANPSTSIS